MTSKTTILLLLSNLVFIQGISLCCHGNNTLSTTKKCVDGTQPMKLNCDRQFVIRKNDNTTKIEFDKQHNLILDDDLVPPNEYCMTTILSKNAEAYIICAGDDDDSFDTVSRIVNTILALTSVLFIIITILIYLQIPEVLDLQDICLIHSISGLALGYIVMSIINFSEQLGDVACHFLAYLMYFSFMYCFFWMNIVCFHIYKCATNFNCLSKIKNWKTIYYIYGIGAPLLALTWVIFLNHAEVDALKSIHPGIGITKCWFNSLRETFIFFYGPILVLLAMNIIFFFWTGLKLWQRSKNCPKTKAHKYRLRLFVKLFFIMGITWIFEIISSYFNRGEIRWIWIVTDILNALQGVIIFLLLVVFRKKVKRALANRKLCSWRLPVAWKNDKDSECEELEEAEFNLDSTCLRLN